MITYQIEPQMMTSGRINHAVYRCRKFSGGRVERNFEFRVRTKLGALIAVRRFKRVDRKTGAR